MSEMKDLIAIFKAETEEHLVKLENGLVRLEKDPDNLELARSLNREVHTLKGAARVFGFSEIQEVSHRIEDIFETVSSKRGTFNSFMAERMFKGLDAIRSILEKIVQEQEIDFDASNLCRELEACIAANQDGTGTGAEPPEGEKDSGQPPPPVWRSGRNPARSHSDCHSGGSVVAGPGREGHMDKPRRHTTIGLRKVTKRRLDGARAPGQAYDGFICQLMDLWEEAHKNGSGAKAA